MTDGTDTSRICAERYTSSFDTINLADAAGDGDLECIGYFLEKADRLDGYALYRATEGKHLEAVKLLLEAGDDPNYVCKQTWLTPLALASLKGWGKMVDVLLAGGADPDVQVPGMAALYMLHDRVRDFEYLKTLLGGPGEEGLTGGGTALMLAALKKRRPIVRRLMKAGADVNLQEFDGWTALMYAAHARERDIVELLVKAGADGSLRAVPSARDFVLSPPWDEAFSFSSYTHSILEEARAGDFSGPNAFMIAMAQGMSTDPIPEVCDIRAQDHAGYTGLHYVVHTDAHGLLQLELAGLEEYDSHGPGEPAWVNIRDGGGRTAVMLAALKGHEGSLEEILEYYSDVTDEDGEGDGLDLRVSDSFGSTALMLAVRSGCLACIRLLLRYADRFDVDTPDSEGFTPLGRAVAYGNPDMVRELLAGGADPNARQMRGRTPLILAVQAENPEIVHMLMVAGANPNIADDEGTDALTWSAKVGCDECSRLMGQSYDAPGEAGQEAPPECFTKVRQEFAESPTYALIKAAREGLSECIGYLVSCGADVNGTDSEGTTPLFAACDGLQVQAVRELLARGADPNQPAGTWNSPPILAAVQRGYRQIDHLDEILDMLLDAGADPTAENDLGKSALIESLDDLADGEFFVKMVEKTGISMDEPIMYEAAVKILTEGPWQVFESLVERGLDVSWTAQDGRTLLMIAAQHAMIYNVLQILMQKVDTSVVDPDGLDALHYAASAGRTDVGRLLVATGLDVDRPTTTGLTPLMFAANAPSPDMMAWLISEGADVHAATEKGRTALHYALYGGCAECVELLEEHGVDITVTDPQTGDPPMIIAARVGSLPLVRLLSGRGLDVNCTSPAGDTPLHVAVERGDTKIVKFLVSAGANPNAMNGEGLTPLMLAVKNNRKAHVKAMLAAGGNPNLQNGAGESAFSLAKSMKRKAILKELETHQGG